MYAAPESPRVRGTLHKRGEFPPESYSSPVPRPKFYDQFDSPLSTKREKMMTPNYRTHSTVPRLARTAPALGRLGPRRFQQPHPSFITFKEQVSDGTEYLQSITKHYNPNLHATYFEQVFILKRRLGEGSFGEVFHVVSRDDGREYAVKKSITTFKNSTDRELKLREVKNHELLPRHENLVAFVKSWEERGYLFIQSELCDRSLLSYCEEHHYVEESQLWSFFIDLLRAVDLLHSNDLLHLDIKPENIFLTKDRVCKLGDFGLIFDLNHDQVYTAEEGDSKYLAPEVLNGHPTKAADIFSLGITILEVAADLDLPSRGNSWHELRSGRVPEKFMSHLSSEMRHLILWMIAPEPQMRPSTKTLLENATVRNRIWLRSIRRKYETMRGYFYSLYLWLVAIVSFVATPIVFCCEKIHQKKKDAEELQCSTITPFTDRTCVQDNTPDLHDQPVFPKLLEFDCSLSDDENLGRISSQYQRAYTVDASRRRSAAGSNFAVPHQHNPNPSPYNLRNHKTYSDLFRIPNLGGDGVENFNNDNDDTPSSSSSVSITPPGGCQEAGELVASSPNEERIVEPSPHSSPNGIRRRPYSEFRPKQKMISLNDRLNASGDWCSQRPMVPKVANPLPALSFDDSDDDEASLQITAVSCPPRAPLRSALRSMGKKPVPKLDFSLLDSKDQSSSNSGSGSGPGQTLRRRSVDLRRQRMVGDRGSSADDDF